MNIDKIIQNSAKEVFFGLESGQLRILQLLSLNGPTNLTELGKLTSKKRTYTGFDRWGVKKRLQGSGNFNGLIPNDYVYEYQINVKEKKYSLTLKGFIASLVFIKFEDHYLIKQYQKTIEKYLSDKTHLKYVLDYIKKEIAYFLYANAMQGINMFKFKFLKKHINKNRNYEKANYYLDAGIEDDELPPLIKNEFQKLRREYGKSYQNASKSAWYYTPEKVFREWKKHIIKKTDFNPQIKESIVLNNYTKYWYNLIDLPKIDEDLHQQVTFFLDTNDFDVRMKIINMKKDDLTLLLKDERIGKYLTSSMTAIRLH